MLYGFPDPTHYRPFCFTALDPNQFEVNVSPIQKPVNLNGKEDEWLLFDGIT